MKKKPRWLPWTICGIALAAAGGGAAWLWLALSAEEQALRQLQNQVQARKAEIAERREALAILAEEGPRFRRRWPQGWQASRLDWVAAIADVQSLGVPQLRYTIQPRRTVWNQEGIQLWRSQIELDIGLVHEMGLLRFWQALQTRGLGDFSLESCRLARAGDEPAPGRPNLTARCRLDWYGFARDDPSTVGDADAQPEP